MKDKLRAFLITLGLFGFAIGVIYTIRQWPNEFFISLGGASVAVIFIAVYKDILNGIKENKLFKNENN